MNRYGGVECGGTSFAVSFAEGSPTNVVKHESIPTSTPEETLRAVASTLVSWKVQTLGIGSFGPVCLNKSLPEWGYITTTPKPKWAQTDVVGLIRKYMVEAALEKDDDGFDWKSYYTSMPIAFNTDVNTAALAEMQYGDHGSVSSCAYITIGTGIGVGIVSGANLVTNMLHPEAGHVLVRKHEADKDFPGTCPFHGDCLEGVTNNHSLAAKAGCDIHGLRALPDDCTVQGANLWDVSAYYIAQLCVNLVLTVSPEVIVIGGGIAKRNGMFPMIRRHVGALINGYVRTPQLEAMETYIVPSKLNTEQCTSGAIGAIHIGMLEAQKQTENEE